MNENNYELTFSEKVQQPISELVKKYGLVMDLNMSIFERLKKKDPEIVIFKAAKKIVEMKEGTSMKDVVHLLKIDLKINQKTADELAHDVKDNIALWIEIKNPEEEVEKQKQKTDEREKENLKEKLLEKLRVHQNMPKEPEPEEAPPVPQVKTAQIADVEENAAQIRHIQQREAELPAKEVPKKEVDPYKEPVE